MIEKRAILALHDLVALRAVQGHPAGYVLESCRSEAAALADSLVDGLRPAATEGFDDHIEHPGSPRDGDCVAAV